MQAEDPAYAHLLSLRHVTLKLLEVVTDTTVVFLFWDAIDTTVLSLIFHTVDTTVVYRPHDRYVP